MSRIVLALTIATLIAAPVALAQLPPDAVHLGRVKIPEKQKSQELDPVTLEAADPSLPTWEHEGVKYGSSKADSKDTFLADPAKYIDAHAKQLWENNFVVAMSRIWCPVTDEISAGGGLIWNELGIEWESCCQFCNDTKTPEDFPRALKKLKERAAKSYEQTHGKYVAGASSPVAGAIDFGEGFPDDDAAVAESGDKPMKMALAEEPGWLKGQDLQPTLGGGVGTIFANRCVECHRPGGSAPMAFMTLGEIRKWSAKMKENIETRLMPPFPPKGTGHYSNSKWLTDREKETLLAWIAAGYPPGEGEYKPIEGWDGEWMIGTPDHVFTLESHTIPENVGENVKEFTIKTDFPEDRFISAAQIIPTDTFLILYVDAGPLGAYHNGNSVTAMPETMGYLLKKGEEVKVRVFYLKEEGWEETDDNTRIGVKFAARPAGMAYTLLKDRMGNDEFTIPAGKADAMAKAEFTFAADGNIVSLTPVLRERGKSLKAVAVTPDGKETELLSIGYWDPMWHYTYRLAEPVAAPKGTVVRLEATYDNSEENVRNPDASAEVKAGPGGEVLEGWLEYALQ